VNDPGEGRRRRAGSGGQHFREAVRMAVDVMVSHKTRSSLVILGVGIGVTVLMGMVAILSGLGNKIQEEITSSDRAIVTLSKYDFLTDGDPEDERILARPDILPEDAPVLQESCESVEVAEFYIDADHFTVIYHGDQRTRPIGIAGGGAQLPYVYNLAMGHGRYFSDAELLTRANVLTLGHGPAEDLFPNTDPIGKRVRVGDDHYEVIGVWEARKSVFGGMSDNFAIIPWTTFKKNLGQRYDPYFVYLTVADGYTPNDVVEEGTAVMRRRHGLNPSEKNDFVFISNDRINDFVRQITGPIGLVLLVMSSIGLTVGGIGVMNIMLVSVTERTREIGIRMALGARRRMILTQFLIEAGTLTGIGGVLGVLAGSGLAWLITSFANVPANINPGIVLAGVAFSVGVGVFFGLYPASKASRLDPIEALRYE
jgi:putative ABC transport system permease protein